MRGEWWYFIFQDRLILNWIFFPFLKFCLSYLVVYVGCSEAVESQTFRKKKEIIWLTLCHIHMWMVSQKFLRFSLLRLRNLKPLIMHNQLKLGKFFLTSGSYLRQFAFCANAKQLQTFPDSNPSWPCRPWLSHSSPSFLWLNNAFKPSSKFPFSTPLIICWSSLSFSASSFKCGCQIGTWYSTKSHQ